MKSIELAFGTILAILLTCSYGVVTAQCPNDNSFLVDLTPVGPGLEESAACVTAGDYATVTICNGTSYTFTTCGGFAFDTYITLINPTSGLPLATNDDACGVHSELNWVSTYSGTVRVLVDKAISPPCGHDTICVKLTVIQNSACSAGNTPINDDPCGAIELSPGLGIPNTYIFDNSGATSTALALSPLCGNYVGGDVWFYVIAPSSGALTFAVEALALTDGALAMYSNPGSCGTFFALPDECDTASGTLDMPMLNVGGLTAGDTMYFRFWDEGNNAFGTFQIELTDPSPGPINPCNTIPDEPLTACDLGILPASAACDGNPGQGIGVVRVFNLSNVGATAGSPYLAIAGCQTGNNMNNPAADVWYTFVAGGPSLRVNVSGSLAAPNIALWEGTPNNLVPRACIVGITSTVEDTFELLTVGNSYYLQISGNTVLDQAAFDLTVQCLEDCQDCLVEASLTASPQPIGGVYAPGTNVTFTFEVTNWNYTLANWFHGVELDFGSDWNLGTLSSTPAATCDNQGSWAYYSSVTSSATSTVFDKGFYYDRVPTIDGNPGNNFGDFCSGPWIFTWNATTSLSGCGGPNDLNVTVNTTGDGESGSWSSFSCADDPEFTFVAGSSCLLPVDYLSFTGEKTKDGNLLNWATARELQNDYFILERSTNGFDFEVIDEIDGSGTTDGRKDYTYHDPFEYDNATFYRLMQVDENGTTSKYSDIVLIAPDHQANLEFRVFPNPVRKQLNISAYSISEANYHIEISDLRGMQLLEKQTSFIAGQNNLELSVTSLSPGVYFVKMINTADGSELVHRFVK